MAAERLYYDNAALTEFSAAVTDIREHSRADGLPVWQVALDRTAFYPTSGGQPHDTGALRAVAASGARLEAPVHEVFEDEQGEIWHLTPKPLVPGTAIEGAIDAARRLDHMQQHSGQHLLSALFDREYGARTVSFHLGDRASTIDLEGADLDEQRLAAVETLANRVVAENRPVTLRTVSAEEAAQMLADGLLRKLPPRGGEIRLVILAGEGDGAPLDVNACGGTHVASSAGIGPVLLRGTERVRQAIRVSFLCGGRALAAARADDALLTRLGRTLSATRGGMEEAVVRIQSDARALAKERQGLREELADYHAARLVVETLPEHGFRIVRRVFTDRDADYVKLLAARVAAAAPHSLALFAAARPGDASAAVVLAAGPERTQHAGEMLRTVLAQAEGRGGGSPSLAQGLVPQARLAEALDALEAELGRATPPA